MRDDDGVGLTGRKALVTGAASGIGAAVARELAGHGADVVVCDVDADGAQALAAQIGGEAWAVDLSDTAALADLRLDVDVVVNNAGIQHDAPMDVKRPVGGRRQGMRGARLGPEDRGSGLGRCRGQCGA
ncbi:SDR family NAD(P)-dependent oxidoreductase [Georgenia subflava]|uniref:SDR family NAD(P)-dependent oxidoreductase n=1 Tax=Georgenia subflava TaxID=1622177 RepID=A0A6N7END3_9MICO|nr:SDR family NAD(P)-dependent oxidoreductase [Georgenia subflava]